MTDISTPKSCDRVGFLLTILNSLPGMSVSSTCDCGTRGQSDCDDFFVVLKVEPTEVGFLLLTVVTKAAERLDPYYNITPWVNGYDYLMFTLRGVNGANPDELADTIEQVMVEMKFCKDPDCEICNDCREKLEQESA